MSPVESANPVEPFASEVTILIISDYTSDESSAGQQLRETLVGLAKQQFDGSVKFMLVECQDQADTIPDNLADTLPGLCLELAPISEAFGASYQLKNHAVKQARTEWIIILDADCVPEPGWLSAAMQAVAKHPEVAAISGKTVYTGRSLGERILGVLSRAYLDRRGDGHTRFVSNNNAIFRRSVYIEYPLPVEAGPFSARIHSEALTRNGHVLLFEPAMLVTHDFEGWAMERDIRRNIGWATIKVRQLDPGLPHTWAIRLGPLAVMYFYLGHVMESWWHILRIGHDYGLKWYEKPLAMATAFYVHALEIDGMWKALRAEDIGATAYR